MLDRSMYNLSNPSLHDDIGESNMNRMLPACGLGYIPGITGTMNGVSMQGSLRQDQFQPTRKEKDKAIWKNILAGAIVITGGILCFKVGKSLWNGLKNIYSKIKAKFKK